MNFEEYIVPELLVLIPVLYLIGMGLRKASFLNNSYIPIVLGVAGVVLAVIYEFSSVGIGWMPLFVGVVQGILCAGASVYGHQIIKQLDKGY